MRSCTPVSWSRDATASDSEKTIVAQAEELRTIADSSRFDDGGDGELHVPAGHDMPEEAILGLARQHAVVLSALGMRKRSRVGKLVLGCIAQQILFGADSSVPEVKGDT